MKDLLINKTRMSWAIKPLTVFCAILSAVFAQAQDLHFSQFMNNPLLTNPANTGFNPDYDYRIGASYRSQWSNLPVPYKTMGAWGDVQILRNSIPNGWIGVGGVFLRDVAGTGSLTSTKAYGSVAYHQEIGEGSLLSAGFNVGYASKSINANAFKWESQWNGKFFESETASGEPFASTETHYFDLQAGLNYAYFINENAYLNFGVSMLHINRPRESFFSKETSDNRVPQRYNAFVNASFKLNDQWILNPNVYYSNQANSSEIVGGLMAQYNLSGDGDAQLIGGAYYRWGDAAVAMLGIEWKSIRLSFTYDATVSSLGSYNNGQGAMEFSLIKFGEFQTRTPRQALCPEFQKLDN